MSILHVLYLWAEFSTRKSVGATLVIQELDKVCQLTASLILCTHKLLGGITGGAIRLSDVLYSVHEKYYIYHIYMYLLGRYRGTDLVHQKSTEGLT